MILHISFDEELFRTKMHICIVLQIEALEIEKVAAPRSFLWIWCGSSDGLDAARRVSTSQNVCALAVNI